LKDGHPHICLYRPEIPQNTGNIARLAAATHSRLHLIQPTGFSLNDRNLLRSGLDYWPYLDLEIHASFDEFKKIYPHNMAFFSKFAKKTYDFLDPASKILVFGQETSGLPKKFHDLYPENFYRVPIDNEHVRSLNVSNTVAIIVYHYLKNIKNLSNFL